MVPNLSINCFFSGEKMNHRRQSSSLQSSISTPATLQWENQAIAASKNIVINANSNKMRAAINKMAPTSVVLHRPNNSMILI